MFIKDFLICLVLFVKLYSCSLLDKNNKTKKVILNVPESPERNEFIAREALLSSLTSPTEINGSIFKDKIEVLAKAFKRTQTDQYIILVEALCGYLDKYCLETIQKYKLNQLVEIEKYKFLIFVQKFGREVLYFSDYDVSDYEIPERTVTLIFKALQLVSPNSEESLFTLIGLANHCKSKACAIPLFDMLKSCILKSRSDNQFTAGIAINIDLKALPEFDGFISELISPPLNSHISTFNVIRTLLRGPVTDYSNEVLLNNLSEGDISLIIDRDWYVLRLANRINKSNLFELAMDKIKPLNAAACNLRAKLLQIHSKYGTINQLMSIDYQTVGHNEYLDLHRTALTDYYNVDRKLVTECALKISEGIAVLVDRATREKSVDLFKCAITYLGMLPDKRIPELFCTNYENILDLALEPSILNNLKLSDILSDGFINIVRSYHSKITPAILQKFCIVFSHFGDETISNDLTSTTFFILLHKILIGPEKNPFRFIEVFKMIHEFSKSIQMDFSVLTSGFIMLILKDFHTTISTEFLDYCIMHGLISKTQLLLSTTLTK